LSKRQKKNSLKGPLTVGRSKAEAGEGRTTPPNADLFESLTDHARWYAGRFAEVQPDWLWFANIRFSGNGLTFIAM
jgi:hypothetical protein